VEFRNDLLTSFLLWHISSEELFPVSSNAFELGSVLTPFSLEQSRDTWYEPQSLKNELAPQQDTNIGGPFIFRDFAEFRPSVSPYI
jgi:hypothetical protein